MSDQEVKTDEQLEDELIFEIGKQTHDPLAFVLYAFPWKEEGTELADQEGPDVWQREVLEEIRDGLKTPNQAIQEAVASGHGIGKSALVSWIILWALATFEDTRGIVTANTESQLKNKTWAELAKWYRLCAVKHWFVFTATAIYSSQPEHEKTWRVDMVAWSEHKTEAFAGLHNKGKRILVVFDEGSGIPDKIYEVTEGALTDANTEILWCVFGNPTRNNGRFFDCFHKLKHRWKHRQIDSRKVRITNKEQIKKWIEDFGEDSDFVRVRVRGVFPKASASQFIPYDIVQAARGRKYEASSYAFAPKILVLDNAWTGGDEIVIGMRQGLVHRIMATFQKNDDDFKIAGQLARIEDEEKADAVLIDLGYGTGVYSAGKQLKRSWMLLPMGGASPDPGYLNMRAYCHGMAKKWLQEGGSLPDDEQLCSEACWAEGYVVQTGRDAGKIFIESKDDMKKRGLGSPNRWDTLIMSFAIKVMPKAQRFWEQHKPAEYEPLADLEAKKPHGVSGQTVTPYDPYAGL